MLICIFFITSSVADDPFGETDYSTHGIDTDLLNCVSMGIENVCLFNFQLQLFILSDMLLNLLRPRFLDHIYSLL